MVLCRYYLYTNSYKIQDELLRRASDALESNRVKISNKILKSPRALVAIGDVGFRCIMANNEAPIRRIFSTCSIAKLMRNFTQTVLVLDTYIGFSIDLQCPERHLVNDAEHVPHDFSFPQVCLFSARRKI